MTVITSSDAAAARRFGPTIGRVVGWIVGWVVVVLVLATFIVQGTALRRDGLLPESPPALGRTDRPQSEQVPR